VPPNLPHARGPTRRGNTMYQNFETLNDLIEYLQELAEQED
jgi:hypothetical protein